MPKRAVIYVQPGPVAQDKQIKACADYCLEQGWQSTILRPEGWHEAIQLFREGQADVLLLAYRPRGSERSEQHDEIRRVVETVGGQVHYCRDQAEPRPRQPIERRTEELVRRMIEAGIHAGQIARVLDAPERIIQSMINRLRDNGRTTE